MPHTRGGPNSPGQKSISSPLPWVNINSGAGTFPAAAGGKYHASTFPNDVDSHTRSTPGGGGMAMDAGGLGKSIERWTKNSRIQYALTITRTAIVTTTAALRMAPPTARRAGEPSR